MSGDAETVFPVVPAGPAPGALSNEVASLRVGSRVRFSTGAEEFVVRRISRYPDGEASVSLVSAAELEREIAERNALMDGLVDLGGSPQ